MKVERCHKGRSVGIPIYALDGDGYGWTTARPPDDGVVFKMNVHEAGAGGAFVTLEKMLEAGFIPASWSLVRVRAYYMSLSKDKLVEIARASTANSRLPTITARRYSKEELVELLIPR